MPVLTRPAGNKDDRPEQNPPVVCVGLSAGGLQPLETIFRRLTANTGLAYVVIAHLQPEEPTILPSLLESWSKMPSQIACTGMTLEPNKVYVIPPGQEIAVSEGSFAVQPRSKPRGWSNVITIFLYSLIHSRKPAGVAVILSGFDSDGSAALRSFRDNGGITIAQDLESAQFKDMPQSAIDTGMVDFVLSPKEIAAKLEAIARNYPSQADDARSEGGAE